MLRNGRLNQMAYSLFLFMRDIAACDFVGWINQQLATVPSPDHSALDRQEALLGLDGKLELERRSTERRWAKREKMFLKAWA
jgi:hypothetical protein